MPRIHSDTTWYSMSTVPLHNDLAAIVERLEAIEKILAEYIDTVRAAEERERELQERQRLVRAEITFDDASKRETQAEANRQHATQRAIARYALWAFCAALFYAGVSAIQLQEMRVQTGQIFHQADVENANTSGQAAQLFRQLNIAQQQARATQEVARVALESLEVSQRAFLVIEFDKIDFSNKRVTLTVKNVGHIPPSDIRAVVHEATVSRPPGNPDKIPNPVEEMHWTDETLPGYSAINIEINVRIPRADQQGLVIASRGFSL